MAMNWLRVSLLLCFVGFLKEIRPSEPFVTDYLKEPWFDVTSEQLNRFIYPIGTYTTGVLSIVVLLITDFFRYKPIIIAIGVTGVITWTMLLTTTSFLAAQLIQVFYAAYIATEVSYFAYIYAKVPKEEYLKVTSHTRAALMAGKFVSGSLGQTLVYSKLMNIKQLNYITLSAQITATVFAICLPKVKRSIYFYRRDETQNSEIESTENVAEIGGSSAIQLNATHNRYKEAFELMWSQFKCAYSNRNVLLWSLWYSCGVCGYLQVVTYIQILWIAIDNSPELIWNGAVEAGTTLLCAIIALLASRLHARVLNTKIKVVYSLFVKSLLASAAILLAANGSHRFVSYAGYMFFYMFYTFTITISSAEIAKLLPDDSYGLIFGFNTFIALCLQSLLTMAVAADSFGFGLSIFEQFYVYSGYFCSLGLFYFVLIILNCLKNVNKGIEKEKTLSTTEMPTEKYTKQQHTYVN